MTKTKRNLYQSEFKQSAVKLAIGSEKPIAQTAKKLAISKTNLYSWVDKYSRPKEVMPRTDEHQNDELKRLKKDLAKVTSERDLLKKGCRILSKFYN